MASIAASPVRRVMERAPAALAHPDVRFGQWVAAGVLGFLLFVGVLFPTPPSVLVLGAVLGSLHALLAMGIVLIYRANRIINFAAGDLGALASVLGVSLIVGSGVPFFLAFGLGLLAALAIGGLSEMLVIRRFSKSPRLILTVATLALSQILGYGQLALPSLFGYDTAPQDFGVPFDVQWEWFPIVFRGPHLLVVVIVPLIALGLAAFFRFTRVGVAVRASAESADRAALLGIPVKRVSTLVWVIAGGLAGVAVLLRAPIAGVAIGSVLGPTVLFRGLAAAVIARMESLPIAFGVAVMLGVLEQATLWTTGRTLLSDAILFAIVIAALLIQRKGKAGRADDTGVSTWSAVKEVRPIPRELAKLPEVRWGFKALGGLVFLLLAVLPLTWDASRVNLTGVGLIFGMIAISLVILTGWAGQISLGQLAFVAFGAAVTGRLALNGWDLVPSLLAAGIVGAFVAVLIGLPALRIRGPFLPVATLGFALATGSYLLNPEFFPWVPKASERIVRPVLFQKFDLESEHAFYYVILLMLVMVIASATALRKSRIGRTLIATRDNARAAQAYGISPTKARLTAFALSGFIAAFAGGAYAYHQHTLSSTILRPTQSITLFSVVVIGGLGSIPGGLLGAAFETFLRYSPVTRLPLTRLLASGFGLLVILLFLPGGLGGLLYSVRDDILRRIAKYRGIVVSSLVADMRKEDQEELDLAPETSILDEGQSLILSEGSPPPPEADGDEELVAVASGAEGSRA
jgi:branched-chain amino acid transport system permease protein